MVEEVWLHIGTPKSGTSSLQKYLAKNSETLAKQGLAYLCATNRASANDLAMAWNNDRLDDMADLSAPINHAIETRSERCALISSEMFYGLPPEGIFRMFPALESRSLKVLVYLRRQDRYIEAKYLQKSKNARFKGTIGDYINKFDGSGSDFAAELGPWQDCDGDVTLVPRILERTRLQGGDVVSDALSQIGLPAPEKTAETDVNVSPGFHRVQLLQAASRAGLVPPRRLQRLMAMHYPQNPSDRAPIMSRAEKQEFLGHYAEGNEALRARYFPDWAALFATDDLDRPDENTGIPPFTSEQLMEITSMLKVMKQMVRGGQT